MLRASIIFFVIALVAYIFGAYGIAGFSAEMGQILLYVFVALAVVGFVISLFFNKRGGNTPV